MKFFGILFLQIFLFFAVVEIHAQDLTIILFRHAEKEAATKLNNNDPDLTAAGKTRAGRLLEVLKKYKPNQIFSTNRVRTRATVLPLAVNLNEKYRIQTQIYNAENQEEFAERILRLGYATIAVVGHSNTIPILANLLIKQEIYKEFDENEYDKIIVVRIKGKNISHKIFQY